MPDFGLTFLDRGTSREVEMPRGKYLLAWKPLTPAPLPEGEGIYDLCKALKRTGRGERIVAWEGKE